MASRLVEKEFGNHLRYRVAGIYVEKEKILLVDHSGLNDENEFWSPPGGGLHFGESVRDCLLREFKEETGLLADVGEFLCLMEYLNHPLHAVEVFFRVNEVSGSLNTGIDPEMDIENQIIKNVEFLSFDQVANIPDSRKHGILQGVSNLENLMQKRGYFKLP